jgi:hypothetical protein
MDFTGLDAQVAKFRKASPNIASAFDEVKKLFNSLEEPITAPAKYFDNSPKPFVPNRVIQCGTRQAFDTAFNSIVNGDRINAYGFNYPGQWNMHKQLTGRAQIYFAPDVKFVGGGSYDLNAVWVKARGLELFGGSLYNPTGHGLLFYVSAGVVWHGLKIGVDGKIGGTGLRVLGVEGNITNLNLEYETTNCGHDLSLDAHGRVGGEPGTGVHPSYIGGGSGPYETTDSMFVINSHDCATGSNQIGPFAKRNKFDIRAKNLTFDATRQTAGNAAQIFGDQISELDIWVEADNVAQVVRANGNFVGPVRVNRGRSVNVRGAYDSAAKYYPHPKVAYIDCT